MEFNEHLKIAQEEFQEFIERDDRADLDGAFEHLKNVCSALEGAMNEVKMFRKKLSLAKFYRDFGKLSKR